MPVFKPLEELDRTLIILINSQSTFDNFTQEEINKKATEDSSYIQMIKNICMQQIKDVDRNLRKVRSNYVEMLGDNKLLQDSSSYYLYEQILPNKSVFRGLLE
jgi:uncharacterized protein YggL (DUF469 family)